MVKSSALFISVLFIFAFSGTLLAKETFYYCPPPELVKKNEKNYKPWKNKDLFWSIAYRGWPYAEEIAFDQVFFFAKENKIDCRYKWLNPKDNTTFLWTAVRLDPDANQEVIISNKLNWKEISEGLNCTSGRPESCAFEIKQKD